MDYKEYLGKAKLFIKKSTKKQRILAVLIFLIILAIIIIVINPSKKLLEMRNSQRRSDVVNILNSVYQYSIDHDGQLPVPVSLQSTMICRSKAQSCDGLIDISEIINNKKYLLSAVPVDPKEKDVNSCGYQISKLANGRINVTAPLAENGAAISLSK